MTWHVVRSHYPTSNVPGFAQGAVVVTDAHPSCWAKGPTRPMCFLRATIRASRVTAFLQSERCAKRFARTNVSPKPSAGDRAMTRVLDGTTRLGPVNRHALGCLCYGFQQRAGYPDHSAMDPQTTLGGVASTGFSQAIGVSYNLTVDAAEQAARCSVDWMGNVRGGYSNGVVTRT